MSSNPTEGIELNFWDRVARSAVVHAEPCGGDVKGSLKNQELNFSASLYFISFQGSLFFCFRVIIAFISLAFCGSKTLTCHFSCRKAKKLLYLLLSFVCSP